MNILNQKSSAIVELDLNSINRSGIYDGERGGGCVLSESVSYSSLVSM